MRPVARLTRVLGTTASALGAVVALLVLSADPASAGAPSPAGTAPAPSPCAPSAKACFSTSQHRAWLTDAAGHVTYGPVPALGGTRSDPTPTGSFLVTFKDAHHVSNLFSPGDMPNSVFFAPAIAFHEGSLGQPSHGCVHLSSGASRTFFGALAPGDRVQVMP